MSEFGNEKRGKRPKGMSGRWGLFRADIRYHGKRRQWRALAREFYWTVLRGHYTETCGLCGSPYRGFIWHAPDPLYEELIGSRGGTFCPRCFNEKAKAAGIWLTWTPMVAARDGVFNSNWWHSPARDRLMMGFPAPDYEEYGYQGGGVTFEQPPWDLVASLLEDLLA